MSTSPPSTPRSYGVRKDLVYRARMTRLKWILEALDPQHLQKRIEEIPSSPTDDLPMLMCINDVISFLTISAGDCHVVGINSLIPPEDDDINSKIPMHRSGVDDYFLFIERIQHPHALDVVKALQGFILKVEFQINDARAEQYNGVTEEQHFDISKNILAFHTHLCAIMRENTIWSQDNEEQWIGSCDACEKFLFVKMHHLLMKSISSIIIIAYYILITFFSFFNILFS